MIIDAPSRLAPPGRADTPSRRAIPPVLVVAGLAIVGQLVLLLRLSTQMWSKGQLTWDFSVFHQAAWLIQHGHLNPYDSVRGMPFLANNGELIAWPLSLLLRLPGGGWWLLAAQDAAIAATGWVAASWIHEAARSERWRSPMRPWVAVVLVTLLAVVDPLAWRAAAYDFHSEVLGGLFALCAARAVWRGDRRRSWLWAVFTLSAGNVSALYLLCVAVASTTVRGAARPALRHRDTLALGGAALAWMILLAVLGDNRGSNLAANYGYMAFPSIVSSIGVRPGGGGVSLVQIALGAVLHPSRWLGQLQWNELSLVQDVGFGGMLGLLTPWGLAVTALILVPNMLASGNLFATAGFQNEPAIAFIAVGTVFWLAGILSRVAGASTKWRHALLGATTLAIAYTSISALPGFATPFETLNRSTAAEVMSAVHSVPSNAEVVVSQSIAGRFSGRNWVYALIRSPQEVPLDAAEVDFVILLQARASIPVQDSRAMLEEVISAGATVVRSGGSSGLWIVSWHPPPGLSSVVLRGPDLANLVSDPDVFRPAGTPPCRAAVCGPDRSYPTALVPGGRPAAG